MSFLFLCLSWPHRLRISNSSSWVFATFFHSFNEHSPVDNPSHMPSRIVVVWGCKNSFFLLRTHYVTYFFKIFFDFLYYIEYQYFISVSGCVFSRFYAFSAGFRDGFHRKFRRFLENLCQNRISAASEKWYFLCNLS